MRQFLFPRSAPESEPFLLREVSANDREAWRVLARVIRANPKMRQYRKDVDRIDALLLEGTENAK